MLSAKPESTTRNSIPETHKPQRGFSLIELIMFIVIISTALAGILLVMNRVTGHSADTLLRKQALAIAESLLEEAELMPFTFCDPNDANAATATVAAMGANGCATTVEALGPEAGETRYAAPQFDNVNDYNGFTMAAGAGINDITNTAIPGLNNYAATIAVTNAALGAVPAAESLRITVTVTAPDGTQIALDGYRTRYAPNDF
ncbi:MAG: prepilin-type N-terminal cleavage/methylation domain-containing protein [Nitrosomonadales bacterium]|nr:prepilin-type N-terminal cleavage/methylation domain-containing protein [Nitrosomonadales bacterium]